MVRKKYFDWPLEIEVETLKGYELLRKVFLLRAEWGIRFGIRDQLLGTTKEVQPHCRLP